MPGLVDVVRQHGQHYIAQHRGRLLPSHVRALRDIASCRTAALGGHLAHCPRCDTEHLLYHSCRHRAVRSAVTTPPNAGSPDSES